MSQPWHDFVRREADRSSKNWWVTLLLSITLGLFGLDRLYAGRSGLALLKFFTAGGLGLWWLADVVMLCLGTMEDNEGYLIKRPF